MMAKFKIMKAQIYINRHTIAANKKASKNGKEIIDNAAITINTYLGSICAKKVEFTNGCQLIQDATHARCSGATIWMEATFEDLIIDGKKADRSLFNKK